MTSIEYLMRNNAFNFPLSAKPSHNSIRINKFQGNQIKTTKNSSSSKNGEKNINNTYDTHHEQMTVIWKIVMQDYVYALQYLNHVCHEIECSLGFYHDVNFYYRRCHHHHHSIRSTNVNVLFLCIYRPPVAKEEKTK